MLHCVDKTRKLCSKTSTFFLFCTLWTYLYSWGWSFKFWHSQHSDLTWSYQYFRGRHWHSGPWGQDSVVKKSWPIYCLIFVCVSAHFIIMRYHSVRHWWYRDESELRHYNPSFSSCPLTKARKEYKEWTYSFRHLKIQLFEVLIAWGETQKARVVSINMVMDLIPSGSAVPILPFCWIYHSKKKQNSIARSPSYTWLIMLIQKWY